MKNLKNFSILSVSVGISALLSLGLKMYIPRELGVENLGKFHFSEQLALLLFGFMPFGIGSYINKYIPPNPSHAKDILFSIYCFQILFSLLLFSIMFGVLTYMGKASDVIYASFFMGGWAFSEIFQNAIIKKIYIGMDKMKRVSIISLTQKLVLVIIGSLSLYIYGTLFHLAASFFLSSLLCFGYIFFDAVKLGILKINFDRKLTQKILKLSFPYFFGLVLISSFQTIDTIMLSILGGDIETGYYGAANRLIGVFLILIPAVSNAFVPSLSKDFIANKDRFVTTLQNILFGLLIWSLFLSFGLALFGDYAIDILYGKGFSYSYKVLGYLAPVLALTYINTVLGTAINISTNGKIMSIIMALALSLNVILNYFVIPYGLLEMGKGGGGVAVTFTTIVTELFIAICLVYFFPIKVWNKDVLYKSFIVLLSCSLLLVYYDFLQSIEIIHRLIIFLVILPCYVLLTRLIKISEILELYGAVRSIIRNR